MSYIEYNGEKINIYDNILHLNNKGIKDIAEILNLSNQINLKELYLDKNNIEEIHGLENLVNLEVLSLSDNQISEIKGLDSLKNLTFLDLYINPLLEIKGLEYLVNLNELHIGKCKINKMKGLNSLINLNSLDIEVTEIEKIENLENLNNLNVLFLSSNKITKINGLDTLTKLKQLELESNYISIIQGLENLKNLEFLTLFNNQISKIEGLDILQNLRDLSLDGNLITEIENLEKCENLESLYLDSNKIKEIKCLDYQKELENLGLGENLITDIKGLVNLTQLKVLLLNHNKIEEIKGLQNLKNLEELNLEHNNIQKIRSLDHLDKLNHLNLSNNHIKELEGLENLKSLEVINLFNNKFIGIDELIVRRDTSLEELRNYCLRKKSRKLPKYNYYDKNKTYDENLQAFEYVLNNIEENEFIKIGTFEEQEDIREMQNLFFFDQDPEIITLTHQKDILDKPILHLVQIHSLKGINYPKDNKIDFFLFFLAQFWDKEEIRLRGCLTYNSLEPRIGKKVEEMLELSKSIENKTPNMIVFPENSIPYKIIPQLIEFTINNNLVIIGGLEHKRIENQSNFINKAIIIDKGNYSFQIKQTPVRISSRKLDKPIQETIKCVKLPKIRIFETIIGRIAIFICKDFLRLEKIISAWASINKVDFIVIPSLTSKILPFHAKLLNIFNQKIYPNLKIIFTNIGEYGGSEIFSINEVKRIEESFRIGFRDNVGETIIIRELGEEINENYFILMGKFLSKWAKLEKFLRDFLKSRNLDKKARHYSIYQSLKILSENNYLHKSEYSSWNELRNFKNRIAHGDLIASEDALKQNITFLEILYKRLKDRYDQH